MTTGRRRQRARVLDTAMRGAAAGVVGGLAVSLLEREVISRLVGGPLHRTDWDDQASRAMRRIVPRFGPRSRIAIGVGTQLLYAGLLGAGYAVAHERTKESRAGRALLDGAMTYAASLVFPEVPQPSRKHVRNAMRRRLAQPANPAVAFSRVTLMAFGALAR